MVCATGVWGRGFYFFIYPSLLQARLLRVRGCCDFLKIRYKIQSFGDGDLVKDKDKSDKSFFFLSLSIFLQGH